MKQSLATVSSRQFLVVLIFVFLFPALTARPVCADAQNLYGIHWWGHSQYSAVDTTPKSLLSVPAYSAWDMEVALTNYGTGTWWAASYFSDLYPTLVGWNVTPITRIDYNWDDCVPSTADPNYAGFPSAYVSSVNQLYNNCHIWIVGNEPNLLTGSTSKWPNNKIPPADYAAIYRSVRSAVHSSAYVGSAGKHIVLVAGPSPGAISGPRWMSGTDYLDQVLANIPPSEVDGVAIHSYGGSVASFHNDYQAQLQVIDNRQCGSKPVWMTEFNRYTTDNNDEQYSAQFARDAFSDINTWNQTPGNHNIVGATWFVYDSNQQAGGGWNGYAIEYWKDNGFPSGDSRDLFTAFQQSVSQHYAAGKYGVNYPAAWSDQFNATSVDQTAPEPDWTVAANNGTISESLGYVRMLGGTGPCDMKVCNTKHPNYGNFVITTAVYLADARSTVTGGESNAEIRFRSNTVGAGYSLSFKAGDSPNVINLRRSDTWQLIQGKQITYSLPTGTKLYVRIECNGYRIKIQVGKTSGANDVVDWDFSDTTFPSKGTFWLTSYQMTSCWFDYFTYTPLPSTISGTVKNNAGSAAAGATVSLSTNPVQTATTAANGTYSFAGVLPGTYNITASKAGFNSQTVSNLEVLADSTITQNLTITDATPPTTPVVTDAGAYQTDSSSLTFSWSSSDPETGVPVYSYAISTSSSEADIIPGGGWYTIGGSPTGHTRTGLSLANGQTYYALVRAYNGVNTASAIGVSDGIKIAKAVPSIIAAKSEADDTMVALTGRVVTANLADCMYIEDTDGLSGIKIAATGIADGNKVDVAGFLSQPNGERQMSGCYVQATGPGSVPPYGMTNKTLGGARLNSRTPGTTNGIGTNNIGLLVTTWGKVKSTGTGYFVVDDGSTGGLKVVLPTGVSQPSTNFVIVTGVSSTESDGTNVTSVLRVRKAGDIR